MWWSIIKNLDWISSSQNSLGVRSRAYIIKCSFSGDQGKPTDISHNISDASAGSNIVLDCGVVSTTKACNLTPLCRTHGATLLAEGQPTLRQRWARKLLGFYNLAFTALVVSRQCFLSGLGNIIQIHSDVKDNWGQTDEITDCTDTDSTALIHNGLRLLTINQMSKFTLMRKK